MVTFWRLTMNLIFANIVRTRGLWWLIFIPLSLMCWGNSSYDFLEWLVYYLLVHLIDQVVGPILINMFKIAVGRFFKKYCVLKTSPVSPGSCSWRWHNPPHKLATIILVIFIYFEYLIVYKIKTKWLNSSSWRITLLEQILTIEVVKLDTKI